MIYQPLLCLSLRLVTLDLGQYLLSFKIQKSPTSWINCCKSMSTWQQTFFVLPGYTSHLLHVANLRLTNTFQSCLINHLINSYNSPTGEHCMRACLFSSALFISLQSDYFYQEVMKSHIYWPKQHRYTANQSAINYLNGSWGVGLDHAGKKMKPSGQAFTDRFDWPGFSSRQHPDDSHRKP